jgi:hypothetical protein
MGFITPTLHYSSHPFVGGMAVLTFPPRHLGGYS